MGLARTIKRTAVGIVAVALVGLAGLYLAASHVPSDYHPQELSQAQREMSAKQFVNKAVAEFYNRIQLNEPSTMSFSEKELNEYLASMDEIAALDVNGKKGAIYKVLDEAGLSGPAMSVGNGTLRLMVRLKEQGKVLSIDIKPQFVADGRLKISLVKARLGDLAIPDSMLRKHLEGLRLSMQAKEAAARSQDGVEAASKEHSPRMSADEMASVLGRIVTAIDQEPISTNLPRKVNGRTVRIDGLDMGNNTVTLHIRPLVDQARSESR